MSSFVQRYGKSIAAGAMLVVTAVQAALSDNHINQVEQLQIAIAATTALAVYLVPNVGRYPWVKTAVAVVLACLQVAVTLVDNGISPADWTAVILGGLTAVTVGAAPAPILRSVGAPAGGSGPLDGLRADGPRELR